MRIETDLALSPEELLSFTESGKSAEEFLLPLALHELRLISKGRDRLMILKKSVDARKKNRIRIRYRVLVTDEPEMKPVKTIPAVSCSSDRPVVIGFGPAGMMAALYLSRMGFPPIVIERGSRVDKRTEEVRKQFQSGIVNPVTNVPFGEGGAGTFSDGKLNSGVNDPRRQFVLEAFVNAGAPREILYSNRPHVGTDRLHDVVIAIRKEIESLGGTFLFERTLSDIQNDDGNLIGIRHISSSNLQNSDTIKTSHVLLAVGHSARDTFRLLHTKQILMLAKPMSVGLRIEHKQEWLDRVRYGSYAASPVLPRAEYKLWAHTPNGRTLYTFCMCPGGYVVPSASASNETVTNGMSMYARDGENCNSAILVGVSPDDYEDKSPLAGILYQERLEKAAFILGGNGGNAPGQTVSDFFANKKTAISGGIHPTYRPGITPENLRTLLPDYVTETILEGLPEMDKSLPGFMADDAFLTGIETRSSSPVRIMRNESYESVSMRGLYPCGEGAGYAGGIMSSAIDGLRVAEAVAESLIGEPKPIL